MTEDMLQLPHKLVLNGRKALSVSGVNEVISFDDRSIILRTSMGILTVHGQDLQLKSLTPDGGEVTVEGSVAAMIYEEPRPQRGGLGKLFR